MLILPSKWGRRSNDARVHGRYLGQHRPVEIRPCIKVITTFGFFAAGEVLGPECCVVASGPELERHRGAPGAPPWGTTAVPAGRSSSAVGESLGSSWSWQPGRNAVVRLALYELSSGGPVDEHGWNGGSSFATPAIKLASDVSCQRREAAASACSSAYFYSPHVMFSQRWCQHN